MNVIISPTGYGPVMIGAVSHAYYTVQMLQGDKRGVSLSLWEVIEDQGYSAELKYLTTWGSEREFCWLIEAPNLDGPGGIDKMIREAAKTMLPPGAGYPAMPQFETRQAKLQGMLETLTLVALSDVLRQVNDVQQSDTSSTP